MTARRDVRRSAQALEASGLAVFVLGRDAEPWALAAFGPAAALLVAVVRGELSDVQREALLEALPAGARGLVHFWRPRARRPACLVL